MFGLTPLLLANTNKEKTDGVNDDWFANTVILLFLTSMLLELDRDAPINPVALGLPCDAQLSWDCTRELRLPEFKFVATANALSLNPFT